MPNTQYLEIKGYDVQDIIMKSLAGEPTTLNGVGKLYPITVEDFNKFAENYNKYLMINKDLLALENEDDIVITLINLGAYAIQEKENKEKKEYNGVFVEKDDPAKRLENKNIITGLSLEDLENLDFESILSESQIEEPIKEENNEGVLGVINEENIEKAVEEITDMLEIIFQLPVAIDPENLCFDIYTEETDTHLTFPFNQYELFRNIVMVQNGLVEPKQYEDKILKEWVDKARQARQRKDINFNDIMVVVKNSTNTSYQEIRKLPIIQFYIDYHWACHVKEYEASTLFKTVSSKVPHINFVDSVISTLFKDGDSEFFVDMGKVENKFN